MMIQKEKNKGVKNSLRKIFKKLDLLSPSQSQIKQWEVGIKSYEIEARVEAEVKANQDMGSNLSPQETTIFNKGLTLEPL